MTIAELLNTIKTTKAISSDYELAKKLNLPSGHICEYYKGKRTPNEYACLQIAQATGRDFLEVMALVRIEAEKDETRRQVWTECLQSLAGQGDRHEAATVAATVATTVAETETAPEGAVKLKLVGRVGIEPTTNGLRVRCSTN